MNRQLLGIAIGIVGSGQVVGYVLAASGHLQAFQDILLLAYAWTGVVLVMVGEWVYAERIVVPDEANVGYYLYIHAAFVTIAVLLAVIFNVLRI